MSARPGPRGGYHVSGIPTAISSYERGCQGKNTSPPLGRDGSVVTYIQPRLILRWVIGFAALARCRFQRQCQPQLLVPTRRFHEVVVPDAIRLPKLRKQSVGKKCQPRSYVRLEAYSFFWLS